MSDPVRSKDLQDRLDRLQELKEFTVKCQKQLNEVFETLGWSHENKDFNQEPMEQCPYDPNHMVPVRTLEKHKASCRLRKMGYSAEEQEEMFDPSVCYENRNVKSFLMDKAVQHQVILQARSAAPLMKMEGVFWQATGVSTLASPSTCPRTTSGRCVTSPSQTDWLFTITWSAFSASRTRLRRPTRIST